MNVEIGAEAALFPEKEYISGIFVAVQDLQIKCFHSAMPNFDTVLLNKQN
jgi:hypothetical protein